MNSTNALLLSIHFILFLSKILVFFSENVANISTFDSNLGNINIFRLFLPQNSVICQFFR
jgi:hypothetical protein